MISIVAAIGRNREIGHGNELLWHIPDDLKRFKSLTSGHPVIMGRKTFESIGKPLPNRTNIVITRDKNWRHEGAKVAHSLEDAIATASLIDPEIFIIGGAQIYEQALPHADRLYLTLIDDSKEGDAFLPPYEHLFTKKVFEEKREWNGLAYTWVDLER
jgi:dihydrofolate reductase